MTYMLPKVTLSVAKTTLKNDPSNSDRERKKASENRQGLNEKQAQSGGKELGMWVTLGRNWKNGFILRAKWPILP